MARELQPLCPDWQCGSTISCLLTCKGAFVHALEDCSHPEEGKGHVEVPVPGRRNGHVVTIHLEVGLGRGDSQLAQITVAQTYKWTRQDQALKERARAGLAEAERSPGRAHSQRCSSLCHHCCSLDSKGKEGMAREHGEEGDGLQRISQLSLLLLLLDSAQFLFKLRGEEWQMWVGRQATGAPANPPLP